MPDVVIRNPDVAKLNNAITGLMAQRSSSPAVQALYKRWGKFVTGPYYAAAPDTMLSPVYSSFATAYAVIARANDINPADVDPRIIALAAGDLQSSIQSVGKALDDTLAATERVASKATGAVAKPLMVVGGLLALVALARGNIRFGGARGRK